MRFSRLIRLCMTCQRLLGVSIETPPGQTGTSHGLCDRCLNEQLATIGRA